MFALFIQKAKIQNTTFGFCGPRLASPGPRRTRTRRKRSEQRGKSEDRRHRHIFYLLLIPLHSLPRAPLCVFVVPGLASLLGDSAFGAARFQRANDDHGSWQHLVSSYASPPASYTIIDAREVRPAADHSPRRASRGAVEVDCGCAAREQQGDARRVGAHSSAAARRRRPRRAPTAAAVRAWGCRRRGRRESVAVAPSARAPPPPPRGQPPHCPTRAARRPAGRHAQRPTRRTSRRTCRRRASSERARGSSAYTPNTPISSSSRAKPSAEATSPGGRGAPEPRGSDTTPRRAGRSQPPGVLGVGGGAGGVGSGEPSASARRGREQHVRRRARLHEPERGLNAPRRPEAARHPAQWSIADWVRSLAPGVEGR